MKYLFPAGLILASIAVAGYFVYSATMRSLTPLEGTLLQFFVLLLGLGGSLLIGRQASVSRPHARSAFRRVYSLYLGFSAVARTIDESRDFDSLEEYRAVLAKLEGIVGSQLVVADDALEDWGDIASQDVKDLRERLPTSSPSQE